MKERRHIFGVVSIVLCVMGSVGVVIHAPQERIINSVKLLWHLALQPGNQLTSYSLCIFFMFLGYELLQMVSHRLLQFAFHCMES